MIQQFASFPGKRKLLGVAAFFWMMLSLLLAGRMIDVLAEEALWPAEDGLAAEDSGRLHLDESHLAEGYFLARVNEPTSSRLKMRVEKDDMMLTYDLNGEGEYEVFPLQLGSGGYTVSLYANVGGKKYAQEGQIWLDVQISNEYSPYLYPNQYIDYTQGAPVQELASQVCGDLDDKAAFDAVCGFMKSDFVYDFVRAITVTAGELPDIDGSVERRMGICQDLSAVMVSMLRMSGVPARMMIGYADANYHAWTETFIGGEAVFFDPTAALEAISKPKEYSVERYY